MKLRRSSQGNTAIEILVALGLIGVVTMIIFQLSQDVLKYIRRNQTSTTRDQLATQFRQNAGRVSNLRLSLSKVENNEFKNCVCGTGPGCDTSKKFTLALYDPSSPAKAVPAYYDSSGAPCVNKSAQNCMIEVTVGFTPQCMPALPSSNPTPDTICVGKPAEFVAINFTVRPNSLLATPGDQFKPVSGSVFAQVTTLAPTGSGVCP